MDNNSIENYAKSLIKHGIYSSLDEARTESKRWHLKKKSGLEEPLKCASHPDIETTVEYKEGGVIKVTYTNIPKIK